MNVTVAPVKMGHAMTTPMDSHAPVNQATMELSAILVRDWYHLFSNKTKVKGIT